MGFVGIMLNKLCVFGLKDGEFLPYYRTIVAAITASIGINITIKENRNGMLEQSRIDALPFLSISLLETEYKHNTVALINSDEKPEIHSFSLEQSRPGEMQASGVKMATYSQSLILQGFGRPIHHSIRKINAHII